MENKICAQFQLWDIPQSLQSLVQLLPQHQAFRITGELGDKGRARLRHDSTCAARCMTFYIMHDVWQGKEGKMTAEGH